MALEDGFHYTEQTLPMPSGTPDGTPLRGLSAPSSRQTSSSLLSNNSRDPLAPEEEAYFMIEQDVPENGDDERYNSRDPRRLTPNLGISFVSQIHLLKKELENKDGTIGGLEESLHQSRAESEQLLKDLNAQKVEVRLVKTQMQSLEHETLQALEDLVKERDLALETVIDTRKRLEGSKEKARLQEEEVHRTQLFWEKDKQEWETDKRKMEGKVHVVEERLKIMVTEMLVLQNLEPNQPQAEGDAVEGAQETWFAGGSDPRSSSRLSNATLEEFHDQKNAIDFRASRMSGLHEMGGSQMSGLSLADELGVHEGDGFEDDDQAILSPNALPEEAAMLSTRYSEDQKARKVMGFHTDQIEQALGEENSAQVSTGIHQNYVEIPGKRMSTSYVDIGTQFTPPSTPVLQTKRTNSVSEKPIEQIERFANQSRKRVAIPSIFAEQHAPLKAEVPKVVPMTSAGCQTEEREPISESTMESLTELQSRQVSSQMRSTSTQTFEEIITTSKAASTRQSPAPQDVPVIAIHPPTSRPPSSHTSVVLPPRTRNMGCQAYIELPRNLTSTAMQTEEIRIDRRIRVPPRLQPIKLPPKSLARSAVKQPQSGKSPILKSPRRTSYSPPPPAEAASTAPEIPKRDHKHVGITSIPEQRRPPILPRSKDRISKPSDGGPPEAKQVPDLEGASKDQDSSVPSGTPVTANEKKAIDFSDDDDFADAVPIRKTLSKVQNSWKLIPQPKSPDPDKAESASEADDQVPEEVPDMPKLQTRGPPAQTTSKTFSNGSIESLRRPSSAAKPADIRRTALVSNGIGHAQRARRPSAASASGKEAAVVPPPFAIPTRSSSRKIPMSASDGAASPTPYSTSFFTTRRAQHGGKAPPKRKILRKVQSAAAVQESPAVQRPQPPPSASASSTVPGSPKFLPSTQNQFILPYESVAEMPGLPRTISQPRSHAGEASIEPPTQQTSVVDAIAQTMVGEWMWKYVRKRTSFGITESPQAEFEMGKNGENGNSSGVRHKRWVWLAPYENAIIWSSKQPNSGPALLGKGGRKLMIQSVLDVKDETPLPKSTGPQSAFDRSILILTPQRALKFTAVSRERHYIWLTALSFLSHSSRGMDDLASPPPVPQQDFKPPAVTTEPQSTLRRTPVRDSIRVAKSRSRPNMGPHSFSSPIATVEQKIIQDTLMAWGDRDPDAEDAAEPPQVPRMAAHARKRSSTGPRAVPLSAFHNYPAGTTAMTSSYSLQAPTSRDKYDRFAPRSRETTGFGPSAAHAPMISRRVTDPSRDSYIPPPPIVPDNFFDPAGTMRMEAFVVNDGEHHMPDYRAVEPTIRGKKESRSYRTRQGRKKDLSYWGVAEATGGSGQTEGGGRMKGEDPFMGF